MSAVSESYSMYKCAVSFISLHFCNRNVVHIFASYLQRLRTQKAKSQPSSPHNSRPFPLLFSRLFLAAILLGFQIPSAQSLLSKCNFMEAVAEGDHVPSLRCPSAYNSHSDDIQTSICSSSSFHILFQGCRPIAAPNGRALIKPPVSTIEMLVLLQPLNSARDQLCTSMSCT